MLRILAQGRYSYSLRIASKIWFRLGQATIIFILLAALAGLLETVLYTPRTALQFSGYEPQRINLYKELTKHYKGFDKVSLDVLTDSQIEIFTLFFAP